MASAAEFRPGLNTDNFQLRFAERENGRVVDVLTQINSWHYSQEYLEERVNSNLGEAYRDRFGVFAAKLTEEAGIPVGEVSIEDSGVSFPDGGYSLEYKASDKKTGFFRHSVWFGKAWFDQPERMIGVLQCFELRPREMTLELSGKRSLDSRRASPAPRWWQSPTAARLPAPAARKAPRPARARATRLRPQWSKA